MDANDRRERATEEATQWWNRFNVERPAEISRAEREQFTQWLRESPVHVAELLRIAHVHDVLEHFKGWGEIEAGDAGEAHNVIPLRETLDDAAESSTMPARSAPRRPRVAMWAMAASTCFIAILGAWLAVGGRGQRIETELAERRQVMLDDGTVVQLEPETKLRVRFEAANRSVALDHGRALFRVAKDPQRPFRVSAEGTSVRAVGTAFGVETARGGVIVTVAEGRVAVGRSGAEIGPAPPSAEQENSASDAARALPAAPEIFLTAGQQVTVRSTGAVDSVRTVDTARALAWAQGQLVFENDTLADVLSEFNRYNRTQLRISDPQLATRRVSGVFDATDTETLLAFIRQSGSDVRITQTEEGVVIGSTRRSP